MLDKLKQITTFIFDVDGVLTDGKILITENGDQLRQYNIKDGYAIQLAMGKGYHVCIITGAKSKSVGLRMQGLGIDHVYLGASYKMPLFEDFLNNANLKREEIVYVGDDLPDQEIMEQVALSVCPADAVEEIKNCAGYISEFKGGQGVVRDIIEKVLKVKGDWFVEKPSANDGALKNKG
ncbi:HAD-IIIA family hydrolase [Pedobacter sp. SD-b]|uniref:HAD-IIIA family hydrolase n=1 Tax=Pedobacter segetis TaxID=2793069 RepID=A0ABS1BJH0_9SPHI|nr:HAD-IIIA family hydrolase [Pedobacter segetis]MBK0382947.1 HAD-IIIA family hydrolase [Pedobacter segetis]